MIQLLIVTLFIVSFVCLWVLIDQRKNHKILFIGIPVVFGLVIYSYESYKSLLGKPQPLSILLSEKESFQYISHYIHEPSKIYLWVLKKGNVPHSYVADFTDELKEALHEVNQRTRDGKTVLMEPTSSLEGDGSELEIGEGGAVGDLQVNQQGFSKGGGLEFYTWDYEQDSRFRKN
tara:strand:+ start:1373 stop:1900 length:528 start_codon:yes stop_codon:yes gene_type:complete